MVVFVKKTNFEKKIQATHDAHTKGICVPVMITAATLKNSETETIF